MAASKQASAGPQLKWSSVKANAEPTITGAAAAGSVLGRIARSQDCIIVGSFSTMVGIIPQRIFTHVNLKET
jgi:hypothetical protein